MSIELQSSDVTQHRNVQFQWHDSQQNVHAMISFNQAQHMETWRSEVESTGSEVWMSQDRADIMNIDRSRNNDGGSQNIFALNYMAERFEFKNPVDPRSSAETSYAAGLRGLRKESIRCPYCSKILCSQRAFKIHLRLHNGDKPFQCFKCTSRFASVQGLAVHSGSKM